MCEVVAVGLQLGLRGMARYGMIAPMSHGLRLQEPLAREGVGWDVFEHLADCDMADGRAIGRMTPEQRMVFALNMLRQEANNGGFAAYFVYQGGDTALYAIEAARQIVGTRWSTLIEDACDTVGSPYPTDVEVREQVIKRLSDDPERFSNLNDRLERLERTIPTDDQIDDFIWSHKKAFFV